MRSPIYWNPTLYRLTLRLLYGDELQARYDAVTPLIPAGSKVLDVCAGDGAIRHRLPGCEYKAIDGNAAFVGSLKKQGIDATLADVRGVEFPLSDVILMMGSLYHFIPTADALIERMKRAAKRLIIVEPHVNWSARGGVLGKLAQLASDPGIKGSHLGRFSEADLKQVAEKTKVTRIIPLQRELILVYDQ